MSAGTEEEQGDGTEWHGDWNQWSPDDWSYDDWSWEEPDWNGERIGSVDDWSGDWSWFEDDWSSWPEDWSWNTQERWSSAEVQMAKHSSCLAGMVQPHELQLQQSPAPQFPLRH